MTDETTPENEPVETPEAATEEAPAAATTPEEKAAKDRAANVAARRSGDVEAQPVRAVAKYLRFSAQKGRLVVDQIRGRRVAEAQTVLHFSDRAAAREISKVLKSAVANATNNNGLSVDELYVSAAFVDEGPTFKRWKPRARGRVDRINKRTCHVTVVVDVAPHEMLEGKRSGAKNTGSRAARVAASKATKAGDTKAPAKKAPAKKPAAQKPAAKKPAAAQKEGDS